MAFLIDRLQELGTSLDFTFVDRTPLLNAKNKAGKVYSYYDYTFEIGGETETQKIFEMDHDKVLCRAQPGQVCRAEVNGKYVRWSLIPFGDAALSIPSPSTFKSNEATKQYKNGAKEEAVGKCIYGYMNTFLAQGKNPKEAGVLAVECHEQQELAVAAIMSTLSQ